ncbi:MAG: 2-C-methyl-D-erythritol 4-phosphate cytidylyltransferase [Lachnospiraceae bacterium]|nr:2-C-methyl-D-erythritol 4-phosphate cytidylyltransferase [Lachnospiraceae bacterium]
MVCDVIIPAGGSGTRFGGAVNKILVPLKGKPLLWHVLKVLGGHPAVRRIVIACRREEEAALRAIGEALTAEEAAFPELLFTEGGAQRQQSVYRALKLCREDWVLIHDGARPYLSRDMVDACLEALETYPAVSAGVVSKDTVKIVNEKNEVLQTTDRSRTILVQTPQGFHRQALWEVHKKFRGLSATDDCGLMEMAGYPVKIIPGSYGNIKITTPEDLPPQDS